MYNLYQKKHVVHSSRFSMGGIPINEKKGRLMYCHITLKYSSRCRSYSDNAPIELHRCSFARLSCPAHTDFRISCRSTQGYKAQSDLTGEV